MRAIASTVPGALLILASAAAFAAPGSSAGAPQPGNDRTIPLNVRDEQIREQDFHHSLESASEDPGRRWRIYAGGSISASNLRLHIHEMHGLIHLHVPAGLPFDSSSEQPSPGPSPPGPPAGAQRPPG